MAVEMHSAIELPGKFEKLRFSDYELTNNNNNMSNVSTPSSTATTPPIDSIQLKYITKYDTERVIIFLRKFFFQDEPLNVNVKLLESQTTCIELEDYSLQSIKDGVSVMAINETDDIVGVCLNGISARDDAIEDDQAECKNEKFAKIIKLLDYVDKEVNIFDRYPDIDKMLIIKIISVDTNCRGRGIAKILCDKATEIAKEQGCGLVRIDCSSAISAKVAEKLGYERIYKLKYEDYKCNGVTVFNPEFPHTEVKVYIKRVP